MNLAFEKLTDPDEVIGPNESAPILDDRSPTIAKGGKPLSVKDLENPDP